MLLTALYHTIALIALVGPIQTAINDQRINEEKLPEFDGQILTEPLKPGVGSDVKLLCPIKSLGKYKISWNYVDKQTLLVVQNYVIVDNPRIGINKTSKGDISYWSLIIKNVSLSDAGYYICQINTYPPIRLMKFLHIFVPIEFDDSESVEKDSLITVREGENVTLTCKATGNPKPLISWRRQDGRPFLSGHKNQLIKSIESEVLQLFEVNRMENGIYLCIASNDVSPSIRRQITLNVEFSPTIKIPNKVVSGYIRQNITLECIIESNPGSHNSWIDVLGNRIPHKSSIKYIVSTEPTNPLKIYFKLTIIAIEFRDSGKYVCLSHNRLGATRSGITLKVFGLQSQTTTPSDETQNFNTNEFIINNTIALKKQNNSKTSPKESHFDKRLKTNQIYFNCNNNVINSHFNHFFILQIILYFFVKHFYCY